jgi:hypothetical protein
MLLGIPLNELNTLLTVDVVAWLFMKDVITLVEFERFGLAEFRVIFS